MEQFKPQYVDIHLGPGGRQAGAGRKPAADKKIQTYLMVEGSIYEKLGGRKAVQAAMRAGVETALKQLLTSKGIE